MRAQHIAVVALLLVLPARPAAQPQAARVNRARLMADLRALADPALEGRGAGTEGGRRARALIVRGLEEAGVQPFERRWERPFEFVRRSPHVPADRRVPAPQTVSAVNVAGVVTGRDPDLPVIVLSAHYDHLGVRDGVVYPGADDNASGVAALLAAARAIAAAPLRHTVVFAALDAEEMGLQGAEQFVREQRLTPERVAIDVNLDMVSRNERHEIFAAGTTRSPWQRPILDEVQRRTPVTIRFGHDGAAGRSGEDDWTEQSDQGAFARAGIPFLYFGVEDHADYHKPTDTADRIDPGFFGDVADMVLDALRTIDEQR